MSADGLDITYIYHICYVAEGIFGDLIVRRKNPVRDDIDIAEVRGSVKNFLESKFKRKLATPPSFLQTPHLLGYTALKNGKPYEPKLEGGATQ